MSSAKLFTLHGLNLAVAIGIGSAIFGCSGNKANQRQVAPGDQTSNQNQTGADFSGAAMEVAPALPSTVAQRTIRTPIVHTELMQHERQHFAYAPGFDPNPVTFDRRNRPYMLRLDGRIQKLESNGRWRTVDLVPQVYESLRSQGFEWSDRAFVFSREKQNMIVFDNNDNLYVLMDASRSTMRRPSDPPPLPGEPPKNYARGLLLHSNDLGETWKAYRISGYTSGKSARFEFRDGHNSREFPPAIMLFGKNQHVINPTTNGEYSPPATPRTAEELNSLALGTSGFLLTPTKNADGTLALGADFEFTKGGFFDEPGRIAKGIFADLHSGVGNTMVSVGNKIHVVFIAFNSVPKIVNGVVGRGAPCPIGTPTYAVTFDRVTKTFGERTSLGCSGKYGKSRPTIPDLHDTPAITVDSQNYLHVVLGAHHDNFIYRKSTTPNSVASWSTPVSFGDPKRATSNGALLDPSASAGSYTYVGLLCDKNDKLHVVARWAGVKYIFRMVYMSKNALEAADRPWDTFRDSYSENYYPRINPTLFVSSNPAFRNEPFAHQHLVVPSSPGYVVFHHKLTMDNYGRLFISYETQEKDLSGDMMRQYCRQWPGECSDTHVLQPDPGQSNCADADVVCRYYDGTRPHDPAMLTSNDGGRSWRLATTTDLVNGILH